MDLSTSHVSWKFAEQVTVRHHRILSPAPSYGGLFSVATSNRTTTTTAVTNVSISGPAGGHFVLDSSVPLACPWSSNAFHLGHVTNFVLANVFIKMANNHSDPELPCFGPKAGITMSPDKNGGSPSFGLVANITSTGGWPGYGMIQVQSAQNVTFENLDGTGGVTLRMETGGGGHGNSSGGHNG
eukprot:COSAG02_NODE_15996_length_1122_cov_1.253177_2_plen_183_part_01